MRKYLFLVMLAAGCPPSGRDKPEPAPPPECSDTPGSTKPPCHPTAPAHGEP